MLGLLNSYSFYTTSDVETNPLDVGKIVNVTQDDNEINTVLYGPYVKIGRTVKESQIPMKIILENNPVIRLQGRSYGI